MTTDFDLFRDEACRVAEGYGVAMSDVATVLMMFTHSQQIGYPNVRDLFRWGGHPGYLKFIRQLASEKLTDDREKHSGGK